jgi:diguanylate cyclase (GGDEF)-like protein
MELREYLRVLVKSWWIILLLTVVSIMGALIFSYSRTPVYEASSSFVVSLASFDNIGNTIYGLDTLMSSQQRIFATYCQIMDSNVVRDEAYRIVGAESLTPANYKVSCNVLPDSNVLRLVVHGPIPEVTRRLNDAIGMVATARAQNVYSYFPLNRLDKVFVDSTPISPNHSQDAALGGIFGLVMGVSLAMILEYLRSPSERMAALSIRHPVMGIYNERYFQQRLTEEINRARSRNRPISVALMRLAPDEDFVLLPEKAREGLLRLAALKLQDSMKQENIVAYMGDQMFGVLLPETPGDEAQNILSRLHQDIRNETFRIDDYMTNFTAQSGLVESSGGQLTPQLMLSKASEALQSAGPINENVIQLVRASPRPFVIGKEAEDEPPTPDLAQTQRHAPDLSQTQHQTPQNGHTHEDRPRVPTTDGGRNV